jgi:hypothetical protein
VSYRIQQLIPLANTINAVQINWDAIFGGVLMMSFMIAMTRLCFRMLEEPEERITRLPQTVRTLRFATVEREIKRDTVKTELGGIV